MLRMADAMTQGERWLRELFEVAQEGFQPAVTGGTELLWQRWERDREPEFYELWADWEEDEDNCWRNRCYGCLPGIDLCGVVLYRTTIRPTYPDGGFLTAAQLEAIPWGRTGFRNELDHGVEHFLIYPV